ncbi:MAG: hypothetical protein KDD83_05590, partial [Caldilineaceae bacterium]|nr:hypothetical protein [Caldilineaceae bacterium]
MSTSANSDVQDVHVAPPASQSFLLRHWQKLAALIIWIALAVGVAWYVRRSDSGFAGALLNLVYLMQSSAWGPIIYIVVYALRPVTFLS